MERLEVQPFDAATAEAIRAEAKKLEDLRAAFAVPPTDAAEGKRLLTWKDLRAMAAAQDLFYRQEFVSHRPVIGPVVAWTKTLVSRVLGRLLRIVLVRQVELNQHSWNLALSVRKLEERVIALEKLLEERHHP